MKKQILTLSAMALLVVASCSKSEEEPKTETVSCQLTEKTYTNGKITYTYNSEGKLASAKDADYQETYSYAANSITWKFIEPDGSIATTIYTLDAQGLVKTSSDGTIDNTFTYDGSGYLTEVRSNASWVGITKYTWANGNLTKIEWTRNGSTSTTSFEYNSENRPTGFAADYTSANEYIWHDGDRQILGSSYFGKQSKNLVSKVISNGNTYQYAYTKDSNGNVTKIAVAAGLNSSSSEFKYSCK